MVQSMTFNPNKYPFLYKHFPHVIEKANLLWGYPEFYQFVENLALQTRSDSRQGFPPEALKEILQMETDHEKIVPQRKADWFFH